MFPSIHAFMNKLKIYQDSKELPFWNYKRIIQTGDFLYMIKSYEAGDEIEADKQKLEEKFNDVVQDYVVSINAKSEEISDYGKYAAATNEINKLLLIVDILSGKQKANSIRESLGMEIDNSDIKELLSLVKVEKSDDLEIQKQKLLSKVEKNNIDILQIKSKLEKKESNSEELDIDEQFISVCLGLEMHVDENKITLYQYGIMVKTLIKKIESLNKAQRHGG